MRTTIAIHDLEVYAFHGVPDAEREIGHRLLIDVEFDVEQTASDSDEIAGTVNYAEVAGVVREVVLGDSVNTLEFLCARVTDKLLSLFPQILHGSVSIAKPMPPMPFIAAEVRVTREFSAQD